MPAVAVPPWIPFLIGIGSLATGATGCDEASADDKMLMLLAWRPKFFPMHLLLQVPHSLGELLSLSPPFLSPKSRKLRLALVSRNQPGGNDCY